MATPIGVTIRNAALADADAVAEIHAASWRRHYRGAYADSFLDGDITADRRDVWNQRLNEPGSGCTLVADDGGTAVGFLHVVFDENARWGSLVDNLHVVFARQRCGLGTALLRSAARAAAAGATSGRLYRGSWSRTPRRRRSTGRAAGHPWNRRWWRHLAGSRRG
jgi:GNAT superfamily N-acetyltransferase